MFQKGRETFLDSTDQFYKDPPTINGKIYNDALIAKYYNNIRMAGDLCRSVNIKSYFFCEPVPFYKNPKPSSESYQGNFKRFDYIYPELEKNKDSLANFHFLGNLMENEKNIGYFSHTFYSPALSAKVANEILNTIKNDLQ